MGEVINNPNELMIIKVSELCRTCLSRENVIYDMYDAVSGTTVKLMEMLNIFREIKVSDKDNLPPKICEECLKQLKSAFIFGKKSLRSQNVLSNIINKTINPDFKKSIENIDKNNLQKSSKSKVSSLLDVKIDQNKNVDEISRNSLVMNDVKCGLINKSNLALKKTISLPPNNVAKIVKLVGGKLIPILNSRNLTTLNNNEAKNSFTKLQENKLNQGVGSQVGGKKTNNVKLINIMPEKRGLDTTGQQPLRAASQVTFKCVKCNSLFHNKEVFMTHIKSHHTDRSNSLLTRTCSVCDICFDSVDMLRDHNMLVHFCSSSRQLRGKAATHRMNKLNSVCKNCCGYFRSVGALKKHLVKCQLSQVNITCDICSDRKFTSVQVYLHHNVAEHQIHVCTFCIRGYHQRDLLDSHVKAIHGGCKSFSCHFCSLMFTNRWMLMKHIEEKHNAAVGSLVCGMCEQGEGGLLNGNKYFFSHLQTKHQTIEPVVTHSSKHNQVVPTIESSLVSKTIQPAEDQSEPKTKSQDHDAGDTPGKGKTQKSSSGNVSCNLCSKVFTSKQTYKKHMATQHGKRFSTSKVSDKPGGVSKSYGGQRNTEGGYLCDICPKRFLRLVNLDKHVSHHIISSLHCVKCGHNADNSIAMEDHLKDCKLMQASKRNSSLLCPTCGKKLRTQSGLRYHLQAHTGVRKFACPSCGRRFLTATNMRKHVRIVHLQIRPYPCTLCERKFPSTDHLKKHVRFTHLKKREHVCKECNKTFCQVSHLTQHMWIHTGIKHFTCPYCPNNYSRDCSLNKHLRRKHWEQEKQKYLEQEEFYQNLENEEQMNDPTKMKDGELKQCNEGEFTDYKKHYLMNVASAIYGDKGISGDIEELENVECYDSQDDAIYSMEVTQEYGNEVEIKQESEDNGDMIQEEGAIGISTGGNIVVDGACADAGEEINVVIVSGEDIMVGSRGYGGDIIW